MSFRPARSAPQFADLKGILAKADIDNPLYQVVQEIIERLSTFQFNVSQLPDTGGVTPGTLLQSFLTRLNEVATLPNSVQLLAGAGIAFDDTVANRRTIFATGGVAPGLHHTTHEPGGTDFLLNSVWTNLINTFTKGQIIDVSAQPFGTIALTINSPFPTIQLFDSDAPIDSRIWRIDTGTDIFRIFAANDALNTIQNSLEINRAGQIILQAGNLWWGPAIANPAIRIVSLGGGVFGLEAKRVDGASLISFRALLNASDITTGTLADARLSANVALENITNFFQGEQDFISVGAVFPSLRLSDFNQGINLRTFNIQNRTQRLQFIAYDDNGATSTGQIEMDRIGNIILNGGGVKFPATNVDSSDPNTLDDFEEGTWTPTFQGATTPATGQTYSVQTGMYTKIGRQVFASFKCQISNVGVSGAGQLRILGLPFANNAAAPSAGVISFYDQLTGITTITLSPHIAPSANWFIVWYFAGQGISPSGSLLYTQLANTAQIIGSVTFMVS